MACPNVESKLLLPFGLTLPSAEEVGQGSDDDDVDDGDLGVGGHDYAGQNAMRCFCRFGQEIVGIVSHS